MGIKRFIANIKYMWSNDITQDQVSVVDKKVIALKKETQKAFALASQDISALFDLMGGK